MRFGKLSLLAAVVVLASMATARAAGPSGPYNQCPALGSTTSCAILVYVAPDGTVSILGDDTQGPYDDSEDTMVGVQNDSSQTVNSITLSSDTDLFGFDGDGYCDFATPTPAQCPYGDTHYEGPNTAFSNISPSGFSGNVDFPNGLAPGASTFFTLEERLDPAHIYNGTPDLTVGPQSIDFGTWMVGATSDIHTATITSTGSAPVSIFYDYTDQSQFSIVNDTCQGATLAPGETCAIDMQFSPDAVGGFSGTLVVNDSGAGSPHTIGLTGRGVLGTAEAYGADVNVNGNGPGKIAQAGPRTTPGVTDNNAFDSAAGPISVGGMKTHAEVSMTGDVRANANTADITITTPTTTVELKGIHVRSHATCAGGQASTTIAEVIRDGVSQQDVEATPGQGIPLGAAGTIVLDDVETFPGAAGQRVTGVHVVLPGIDARIAVASTLLENC